MGRRSGRPAREDDAAGLRGQEKAAKTEEGGLLSADPWPEDGGFSFAYCCRSIASFTRTHRDVRDRITFAVFCKHKRILQSSASPGPVERA